MAKAGLIGCVIGAGVETISLYRDWQIGVISDEDYLKNIAVAGGLIGTTSALTSAVMIPIQSTIIVAGVSTLITIPIVFAIGGALDRIVSPCFGRGEYKKLLNNVKYYTNIEAGYVDFINHIEKSSEDYESFVDSVVNQNYKFGKQKKADGFIDGQLKSLFDSI